MKKILSSILQTCFCFLTAFVFAQPTPVSLRSDVKVEFITNVKKKAARVARDPISKNFFYITSTGNVHMIRNIDANPVDTLIYTEATHGIAYLQGMAFLDSALFLIGNTMIDSTSSRAYIKKAVLQPNGLRIWASVMTTAIYPQSYTWYDHGFSGIAVSPDKQHLYFSSGSRTDHGEIQSNNGLYPGLREVPLTSAMFRIPSNSTNLILPNDDAGLTPYLYADGLRNSFDMDFDPNGELFAVENSGDRDDPDEMNWIRQGKHYGFPWIMGGNDNPQQFSGYAPNNDPLLNTMSHCYLQGYYGNDPSFPAKGIEAFIPAITNIGPHADNYRENSGKVQDGSVTGNFLGSFTSHRSPLGLCFDRQRVLGADLTGDAFVVSYTRKGDSTGLDIHGYPGTICDPGQDLLHIELIPDATAGYKMSATTIVNNFDYPVDAYLDNNMLYVIEYNSNGNGRLFRVTLPAGVTGIADNEEEISSKIFPNPTKGIFTVSLNKTSSETNICVYDVLGNCVLSKNSASGTPGTSGCDSSFCLDLGAEPKGVYFIQIINSGKTIMKKVVVD